MSGRRQTARRRSKGLLKKEGERKAGWQARNSQSSSGQPDAVVEIKYGVANAAVGDVNGGALHTALLVLLHGEVGRWTAKQTTVRDLLRVQSWHARGRTCLTYLIAVPARHASHLAIPSRDTAKRLSGLRKWRSLQA